MDMNVKVNSEDMKGKIILGVAAHPDDLDFGASGAVAKWIKEGATAYFLILTDGSKGSAEKEMTSEKLIKMRREEQMNASKALGVKDVFFLGYPDTELTVTLELKKQIVRYIRMLKPDIAITMDPTVLYSITRNFINHSDHRAAGIATIDSVFPYARDRLTFPDLEAEGLEPHKVKTLYLINFDDYNEVIDISNTLEHKLAALRAHKSQITEEDLERTEIRARETGEKHGFSHAEHFIKLDLPA